MNENNQLTINLNPEQSRGQYANLMMVQQTQEEFILDFISAFPPSAAHLSRIIMSPGHLKRAIDVLNTQLKIYEEKYRSITIPTEPESPHFGYKLNE